MSELEEVLTRDVSSGEIHKRIRVGDALQLQSFEADNLDEAGAYEVITAGDLETAEPDSLCRRCFPEGVASAGAYQDTGTGA